MRRFAIACGLVTVVASGPVFGAALEGCCACAVPNGDETRAFFCVSPTSEQEQIAAAERCEEFPDAQLLCLAQLSAAPATAECVAELRLSGVLCPGGPAAPAVGNLALAGVAGLLGTVGVLTLRRRARRG